MSLPRLARPAALPPPAPPLVLIAEVTHRCPLQYAYCSNPLELLAQSTELNTAEWAEVLRQAEELGVLQVLYTGGEPLLRPDLPERLSVGRALDLYQVLVTSEVGLSERRLAGLLSSGLDAIQLSVQSLDAGTAQSICGGDYLKRKHETATLIRASGLPLILNVVLHRLNLHEVPELLDFALAADAQRIELANSQYYGWALENRAHLLPGAAELEAAEAQVLAFRAAHPELVIQWVIPDYHAQSPKPCMGGWASTHLIVAPDGRALPCPAAYVLPGLEFPDVRHTALSEVWDASGAFNAFQGTAWMKAPCQGCPKREEDYGGCRCQAFLLTGDASAADPVCTLSPDRGLIDAALLGQVQVAEVPLAPLRYRPRTARVQPCEGKPMSDGLIEREQAGLLIDGHLDLAWNVRLGRDLTLPLSEIRASDEQNSAGGDVATLSFGALRSGRVALCLGTLFTMSQQAAYPWGYTDPQGARAQALAQLDCYLRWQDAGHVLYGFRMISYTLCFRSRHE